MFLRNLIDFQCSKCSQILVEPILIPCGHRLCSDCINDTITSNSLNCLLCSKRFGSCVRLEITAQLSGSEEGQQGKGKRWNRIVKHFNGHAEEKANVTETTEPVKANATNTQKLELDKKPPATESNTLVARDTDSINSEMTHFRPICLMPLSLRNAYVCQKINASLLKILIHYFSFQVREDYKSSSDSFKKFKN